MTFLDLIPLVLSVIIWGDKLANKKNNIPRRQPGSSSNCEQTNFKIWARHGVSSSASFEIVLHNNLFRAEYISTKSNIIADAVSRKQWARFRQAAPPPTYPPVFLQHYLQSEFDRPLDVAVSENTHVVQKVAILCYQNFCRQTGFAYWPPTLCSVVQYLVHLSSSGLAYSTARSYLSAISL